MTAYLKPLFFSPSSMPYRAHTAPDLCLIGLHPFVILPYSSSNRMTEPYRAPAVHGLRNKKQQFCRSAQELRQQHSIPPRKSGGKKGTPMFNTVKPIPLEFFSAEINYALEIFSPEMLSLLDSVLSKLKETNSVERHVIPLYDKIAEVCKDSNNGTVLLALAEAIVGIVSVGMKPVDKGVPEMTE